VNEEEEKEKETLQESKSERDFISECGIGIENFA